MNCDSKMLPSPLLLRLQDLKLWQGNLENIIQNRKNGNTTTQSDYETIEGLSAFDNSTITSPKRALSWDKIQISPTKPFELLLEEKIAQDEVPPDTNISPKPKRPFLKKGSGLERYKSKPGQIKTSRCSKKTTTNDKNKDNNKITVPIPEKKKVNELIDIITPLKVPDVNIKPKGTWSSALPDKSGLQEFNLNEKHESPEKSINVNSFNSHIVNKINEFTVRNNLNLPRTTETLKRIDFDTPNNSPKMSPRKIDTSYDRQSERDLQIFETLEQRVENSSFCSTDSSILKMLASTPNKPKIAPIDGTIYEESEIMNSINMIPSNFKRNIHAEQHIQQIDQKTEIITNFLQKLKNLNEKNNDKTEKFEDICSKIIASTDTSFSDTEQWSTNTGYVTQSGSESLYETLKPEKVDMAINTSYNNEESHVVDTCLNCENLQKRLDEYTTKIENIEKEKSKKFKINKDLEKKCEKLEREIKKMEKKYEEEIANLREELKEEKKKVAKEKMIFENYIKESQNRPNRKEREEISNLKKELENMKECSKLKETKNASSQARLRNQIKHLEKDNCKLKEECDNLRKENAKLVAKQKINLRPSETKMLHEINKNLTKLTQETKQKVNVDKKDAEVEAVNIQNVSGNGKLTTEHGLIRSNSKPQLRESTETSNNNSGLDMTNFVNISLEKQYENMFGQFSSPKSNNNNTLNDSKKDRLEQVLQDGTKEIRYGNGNIKTISPDGSYIILKYYNGDVKETNVKESVLKYFYAASDTWHTQFGDGTELVEFPNGQSETKYPDGKCEVSYPDGVIQIINPDGTEEAKYPDGSILEVNKRGERVLHLPNGQREIHTDDQKRREYPDGTIKILYPDGTQETRYANGRVRMKNPRGVLIMDTHSPEPLVTRNNL